MSDDLIECAAPAKHKKVKKDKSKLSHPGVAAEETKEKWKKHSLLHYLFIHHILILNVDEGDIDALAVDKTEKKKKKKKRKLEAEANGEDAAMDVMDAQSESHNLKQNRVHIHNTVPSLAEVEQPPEKKKKRKRDTAEEQGPADPNSSNKEKERKRKKESELTEVYKSSLSPTPPTLVPSSSSAPSPAQIQTFLTTHSITIHTPQNHPPLTPIISFSQLSSAATPIPPKLRSAFTGFKEPTPVQACTWPPALAGQDVVGIAETGSGKTLAFGIPALARLLNSAPSHSDSNSKNSKTSTVTVLVVAPTRELALQTHDTLSTLGAPFGIASVAIFGGVDKKPQIKSLANANKDEKVTRIVVGTPGRILDLVNDGACDLSRSVAIFLHGRSVKCRVV